MERKGRAKMIIPKKPRSDAHLKTLSEEKQAEIIEYLKTNPLQNTIRWLARSGIATSRSGLSKFWKSWHLRQRLEHNKSTICQLLKDLKLANKNLSEEELFEAGQKFFSALAISEEDSVTWKRAQDALA